MNLLIFKAVENSLRWIGKKTGLTYFEVNIIVYYFIIPFSWACLIDYIANIHYFKIGFFLFSIGFLIGCKDFKAYSTWLFHKSVSLLEYFNKFGSNYISSSVIICVMIPIIIYTVLIFYIYN